MAEKLVVSSYPVDCRGALPTLRPIEISTRALRGEPVYKREEAEMFIDQMRTEAPANPSVTMFSDGKVIVRCSFLGDGEDTDVCTKLRVASGFFNRGGCIFRK